MTSGYAGDGAAPGDSAASAIRSATHPHEQSERKRTNAQSFKELFEPASNPDPGGAAEPQNLLLQVPQPRKRKSSHGGGPYNDDVEEPKSVRTAPDRKQNHSEIEKRRRDKMNSYISELSALVPMCGAMARKLDKLTVLRMTVRYLRSVTGSLSACPLSAGPRPAFLNDKELSTLILHMARDTFLLVVGCDRGRLLYLSKSASNILNYEQSELLGQSMFDILHPKDVAKVKEQLSSSDLSPRERLIDAKTMMPLKSELGAGASPLCSGARRSFFCRIKRKSSTMQQEVKEENSHSKLRRKHSSEKKYCVVQFTGYLKSWGPADMESGEPRAEGAEDNDAGSVMCLVAVVRPLPTPPPVQAVPTTRRVHFVSRHAIDGKFTFVDQRVTLVLGFLAQELLGTSLYEYVSEPELCEVARAHKDALFSCTPLRTPPYSFRCKDGSTVLIQTHFKPFRNPWTKEVESLVANNTLLSDCDQPAQDDAATVYRNLNIPKYVQKVDPPRQPSNIVLENDVAVQKLIDSQMESHRIGYAIAEEALRRKSLEQSSDLPAELLQDAFGHQTLLVDNPVSEPDMSYQIRNNVPLSAASRQSPPKGDEDYEMHKPEGETECSETANATQFDVTQTISLDTSGEPIDVIMSLLEADAGLGGPINFSSFPWPSP